AYRPCEPPRALARNQGAPRMSTSDTVLRLPSSATGLDLRLPKTVESEDATGHGEGGPAPKRIVVGYGFWIFLLSDIVMFSAFFATYAVLSGATAGGPTAAQLFDLRNVQIETACLLLSSFCCGIASLAVEQRYHRRTQVALLATGLLGVTFWLSRCAS